MTPWSTRPALPLQAQPLLQTRGDPCYLETGNYHPPPKTRQTQEPGRILPSYLPPLPSFQAVRKAHLHQILTPHQPCGLPTWLPPGSLHHHSSSPISPPDSSGSQPTLPHTPHCVDGTGLLQSLRQHYTPFRHLWHNHGTQHHQMADHVPSWSHNHLSIQQNNIEVQHY